MKQPKKLTREQKTAIAAYHLNVKEWMLLKETDFYLTIIHKDTKQSKIIDKFRR